ncbi:MAG: hypothetical protein IKL84_01020, partial [Clostridia bacterium]|nr:hypothetical protein [Clostridia bacterium]
MKNLKRWIALLLLTALFFTSCSTAGGGSALSVVLAENENITILSENPVTVASGEDAVFQIEVAPGFSIRESSAYTYADGYITVKNVQFPTTVIVGTDFDVEVWLNADP